MRIFRLLILLLLAVGTSGKAASRSAQISISFIDVGQGDATLIRDGNGFDVLVDGGRESAGDALLAYIQEAGVDDLEVVLATHADSDHIGGLITILQSGDIPVESVFFNGYPGDTQTWLDFSSSVNNLGLTLYPMQYPDSFSWGNMNIEVLNPLTGMLDPDQNRASVVLRIDYAQFEVFLPADIDASVENLLPTRTGTLQADVLKVAHHGSKFSTSESFLHLVNPQEAVISVGNNPHGHPASETLTRLQNDVVNIWRTDYLGSIQVISDGESYEMFPKILFLPFTALSISFP